MLVGMPGRMASRGVALEQGGDEPDDEYDEDDEDEDAFDGHGWVPASRC